MTNARKNMRGAPLIWMWVFLVAFFNEVYNSCRTSWNPRPARKSHGTSGDHYPKLIEIPQSDFVHLRKPIDSHCFKTADVKTRQCFIKLFMKFTVWKIPMFTCLQIVLLDWIKGTQCQNKWCQQTSPETPQITPNSLAGSGLFVLFILFHHFWLWIFVFHFGQMIFEHHIEDLQFNAMLQLQHLPKHAEGVIMAIFQEG